MSTRRSRDTEVKVANATAPGPRHSARLPEKQEKLKANHAAKQKPLLPDQYRQTCHAFRAAECVFAAS